MNRQWIEFDVKHARHIIEENRRPQEQWAEPDFVDQWHRAWQGKILAYTLLVDGAPVACMGIVLQEWNKAEAWALFATSFSKHILTIYKVAKAGLDLAFKKYKITRIQATIDPGWPGTVRWIESLGFEQEGRLRCYGPMQQDYLMYSMIPENQSTAGAA